MNLKVEGNTVSFWLRVKPRASRERLTVDSSGELRLEIHAAPSEGQANAACIAFLARLLRVPRSNVELVTGAKARRKLFRIRGDAQTVKALGATMGAASSPGSSRITKDE